MVRLFEFDSECALFMFFIYFFFIQKGMDDLTDWVMKNTVSNTPFVIK